MQTAWNFIQHFHRKTHLISNKDHFFLSFVASLSHACKFRDKGEKEADEYSKSLFKKHIQNRIDRPIRHCRNVLLLPCFTASLFHYVTTQTLYGIIFGYKDQHTCSCSSTESFLVTRLAIFCWGSTDPTSNRSRTPVLKWPSEVTNRDCIRIIQ